MLTFCLFIGTLSCPSPKPPIDPPLPLLAKKNTPIGIGICLGPDAYVNE